MAVLADLFAQFFLLAFVAFGGASALLPELHRVVVENRHWLDDTTFTQLFAIAQAAPGPNVLVVTLIGWEIAGIPGALLATLGICLPMSLLIFLLFGHWERFRQATWREAIQLGVAPLAVGLVASSGFLIATTAMPHWTYWPGWLLLGMVVVLQMKTKLHPLWLIGAGAALGLLGWV